MSYNAYRLVNIVSHTILIKSDLCVKSPIPILVVMNLTSQVLPRDFTDSTGITTDSEIMVRDVKGREWPVRIVYRKHGRYDICGGWTDFLRNNDVIIGNTISCTLTLSSSNIIEVRVVKTGTDKRSANQ